MKDNITKYKIFILLLTIIGLGSGCNEKSESIG